MPASTSGNQWSGPPAQGGKHAFKPTSGYAAAVAKNPKARTKATESVRRKDQTIDKLGAMLGLPKRISRKAIVEEAIRVIVSSPAHVAGVTQNAYLFALKFCDQCVFPSKNSAVTMEELWGEFIRLAGTVNPMLAEVLNSPSGIGSPKEAFKWIMVGRLSPDVNDLDEDEPEATVIRYIPLGAIVDGKAETKSRFENAKFSLGSIDIPTQGIKGLAPRMPSLILRTLSEENFPTAKRRLFEKAIARVVFGSGWEG